MLEVSIFKALGLDDIPNRVIKVFMKRLKFFSEIVLIL
jgi:hypothetical protein